MRTKKLFSTKRRTAAVVGAFALVLGAAGIAAAYFSATGTATGHATVGHATPFTMTQRAAAGKLYPGQHQLVSFTIHNTGGGIQHWRITPTQIRIATTGGNIVTFTTQTAAVGCKSSWFTGSPYGPSQGTLNPGGTAGFTVKVTMSNGTPPGSTQDACETKFPTLSIAFTGPVDGFVLFGQAGGSATWSTTNTAAVLTLSTPPSTPEAAGIEVLKPPSALPTTAPTFTTTAYKAGSPRWYIQFTTGGHVFGYPSAATPSVRGKWTGTNLVGYVSWTAVKTQFAGKSVTAVDIIMTIGLTPPSTARITNVHYGSLGF